MSAQLQAVGITPEQVRIVVLTHMHTDHVGGIAAFTNSDVVVSRTEWQAARNRWIVDRENLTPAQWAQRRAEWFATRDAWIAANRTRAQTRGN